MITSRAWAGKRYAVLGLARSGAATVDALLAAGAEVVAWDADDARRVEFLPHRGRGTMRSMVEGCGAAPSTGCAGPPPPVGEDLVLADPLTLDLTGFEAVVVSPGIPLNRHPIAAHAAAAGVPVIGDIELFAQARAELPPHKVVGITGTNGKSTTTALVHHILRTAGLPSLMGGNIGLPILGADPLPADGVYVLELSSYQLDLTRTLDCDVAVLLNITPDHLDRYESFEAYSASKARLFEMQRAEGHAVLGTDDTEAQRLHDSLRGSRSNDVVFGTDGSDYSDPDFGPRLGERFKQVEWPSLQGPHNAQNAARAITACASLGLELDVIECALTTFPGLPHRMQRVGERAGVAFVNDSKATNAEAAAPALASFPAIRWILGGRAKTAELDACVPHFGNVRSAYTIGEAGGVFADLLRPHMAVAECGILDQAVAAAAADAEPGDTVLLSPAAASFDQFTDYEARGRAFAELVGALR